MNGNFSENALKAYQAALAKNGGLDFSEGDLYDFTRCIRPDGSAYGTGGQCRKGTEGEAKKKEGTGARGAREGAEAAKAKGAKGGALLKARAEGKKAALAASRADGGKKISANNARARLFKEEREQVKDKMRGASPEVQNRLLQEASRKASERAQAAKQEGQRDPVAGLRKEVRAGQAARGEADRQKNISDAKTSIKEIKDEIKNRGPHSASEREHLDTMLRQAEKRLERFETGKTMTREQFQAGLKKMK